MVRSRSILGLGLPSSANGNCEWPLPVHCNCLLVSNQGAFNMSSVSGRSALMGRAKIWKFTMALIRFFSTKISEMLQGKSGKLLQIFLVWVLVKYARISLGRTLFYFFPGQKTKLLQWYLIIYGTFTFVTLNQETCLWRSGKSLGIYTVCRRWFSLTHVLIFFGGGELCSIFYRRQKRQFSAGQNFSQDSHLAAYYSTMEGIWENQEVNWQSITIGVYLH